MQTHEIMAQLTESAKSIRANIKDIKSKLETLEIKLDHYSRTDRLAFGVHYKTYQELDMKCLEFMLELEEVEKKLPVNYVVEDQAVS